MGTLVRCLAPFLTFNTMFEKFVKDKAILNILSIYSNVTSVSAAKRFALTRRRPGSFYMVRAQRVTVLVETDDGDSEAEPASLLLRLAAARVPLTVERFQANGRTIGEKRSA